MKLIVGLGNPGRKYARTRHNIGFLCLEAFASEHKLSFKRQKKCFGEVARYENAVLLKPKTFMNNSGNSVQAALNFYDIDMEDMLVVYDDLDLPTGKLRLRPRGSAGGHRGVQSIIGHLGSDDFKRVRFGIGSPEGADSRNYVLSRFHKSEGDAVVGSINTVKRIIDKFAKGELFNALMNTFN